MRATVAMDGDAETVDHGALGRGMGWNVYIVVEAEALDGVIDMGVLGSACNCVLVVFVGCNEA